MCLSLALMLYTIHEQYSFTGLSEIEEAPGWARLVDKETLSKPWTSLSVCNGLQILHKNVLSNEKLRIKSSKDCTNRSYCRDRVPTHPNLYIEDTPAAYIHDARVQAFSLQGDLSTKITLSCDLATASTMC